MQRGARQCCCCTQWQPVLGLCFHGTGSYPTGAIQDLSGLMIKQRNCRCMAAVASSCFGSQSEGMLLSPFLPRAQLEPTPHSDSDNDAQKTALLVGNGAHWWGHAMHRFDQAMVAFLDCLQQFKDHVESRDVHFKLPYKCVVQQRCCLLATAGGGG